jgi:hypothetical protein
MKKIAVAIVTMMILQPSSVFVDDGNNLTKKLSNPISSLISMPIQANYDDNYGAADISFSQIIC